MTQQTSTPAGAPAPTHRQSVSLTTPTGDVMHHVCIEQPRTAAHCVPPRLYVVTEGGHFTARMYPTAAEARRLGLALIAAADAADALTAAEEQAAVPVPEVIDGGDASCAPPCPTCDGRGQFRPAYGRVLTNCPDCRSAPISSASVATVASLNPSGNSD